MKNSDDTKRQGTTVTTVTTIGDTKPDVLTGEPGSRPVATGIGAASGAAAGAVVGAAAGPVGAVVGGAIGAVAGGLAGKGVAKALDPSIEEAHWRTTYTTVPYFVKTANYDFNDYGPAYRLGWESHAKHVGRNFTDIESDLAREWAAAKGASRLGWSDAKNATQAAWQRISDTVERITPGDSDRDGK